MATYEFRTSILGGSGSLSFDMVRALVESLPVMVTPHWVSALPQPIGVDDVLAYLEAAIGHQGTSREVFEIGGSGRVSCLGLVCEYARQRVLDALGSLNE